MAQFSCRLVTIKYRLVPPVKGLDVCFSTFASSAVAKVPVLTIFGATPAGQRTCLHVHGVFPYIYVPCTEPDPGDRYLRQLASSINHALQLSLRTGSSETDHVFKITVVKGIPFYGYHASEEIFLKIYLYNPAMVKRLCDLLLAGAIMNQVFQPHEAHIPFRLQFMIDYNLAGMNYVNLSAVKFRPGGNQEQSLSQNSKTSHHSISSPSPLSSPLFCSPNQQYWDVNNLPSDAMLCIPRVSVSELEVDGLAADICRDDVSIVSKGYPGLAAIWEEERQRRKLLGMETTLTPPPSPVRESLPPIPNDERLNAKLNEIIYERLGLSSESELDGSPDPSPALLTCSQSCDLVVHEPIHTSDITSSQSMGEDEERQPVVDEEAIQQRIALSQRLSVDALRKSTDTELLDLLMDLDQTQPTQHSSQSVADSFIKSRKTRSTASGSSLFGSPSSSSTGPVVDKPDPDADGGLSVFLDCYNEDVCSSPKELESGDELMDEEEEEDKDKDDVVFDSQFIPCGQPPREVPAEETEVSKYSQSSDVQLEYDMSEIRLSQMEASCDPLLGRLHESPLCPTKRGQQETTSESAEEETANPVHEASNVDCKHVDADSAPQLSASQRRRLISLCSLEGEEVAEQVMEEEVGELEHLGHSEGESEDDDMWLTQQCAQCSDSCKSTPEKNKDDSWTQYLSDSILQLDGVNDPQKNVPKKKVTRQYSLRSQGSGNQRLTMASSSSPVTSTTVLDKATRTESLCYELANMQASSGSGVKSGESAEGISSSLTSSSLKHYSERLQESAINEPRLSTQEDSSKQERKQPREERKRRRKRVRSEETGCTDSVRTRTKKARSIWPGLNPQWAKVVRKYSNEEMLQMAITESLQDASGSATERSNASSPLLEGEQEGGRDTQATSDFPQVGMLVPDRELIHSHDLVQVPLPLINEEKGHADTSVNDQVIQEQHTSTSPVCGDLMDSESLASPPTLSPLTNKALLHERTGSNDDDSSDEGLNEDSKADFLLNLSGSEDEVIDDDTNSLVQFPLPQLDGMNDLQKKVQKKKKTLGMRKQYPLRSQGGGDQSLIVIPSSSSATCTTSVPDEAQGTETLSFEGNLQASSGTESEIDHSGTENKTEASDTQSQDSCVFHSSAYRKTKRKISLSLQKSKKKRTHNKEMASGVTSSESPKNVKGTSSSLAKLRLKSFHIAIERLQESVVSKPLKRFYQSLSADGAKQDPREGRRRKRAKSEESRHRVARAAKARSFWPSLSPQWAKVVRKYSDKEMLQMAITESLQDASGSTTESNASPLPLEGEQEGGRDTQATSDLSELPSIDEDGGTDFTVLVPVPDWELKHSHDLIEIPSPLMSEVDREEGPTDTSAIGELTQEQHISDPPVSGGEPMDNVFFPALSPLSSPYKTKALLLERIGVTEDTSSADEHSEDSRTDFHLKLSTASDSELSADDGNIDISDSRTASFPEQSDMDTNDIEKLTTSSTMFSREAPQQLSKATPAQKHRTKLFSDKATEVVRDTILPLFSPPTCEEVVRTAHCHGLPQAVHMELFYSDPRDVQAAKIVGGRTLKVPSRLSYEFPEFSPHYEFDLLPLSVEGLSHWRTVIGSIGHMSSPTLPPSTRDRNQTTGSYSAKDHKQDVLKQATLFPSNPKIIVPVFGPPSSREIVSWYMERMKSAGMPLPQKEESNKDSKERTDEAHTYDKNKEEEGSLCKVFDLESGGEEARRGGVKSDHSPTPTASLGSPGPSAT